MQTHITDQLAAFNRLYKEMDEIYHIYAKKQGVSDAALWLMYSLYERDAGYTQRELCSAWHYPPQTVNSSLKNLEKQGLIALTAIPGNKKNKLVVLTEKGKEMTQRIISALVLAEQKSLQGLKRSEQVVIFNKKIRRASASRNKLTFSNVIGRPCVAIHRRNEFLVGKAFDSLDCRSVIGRFLQKSGTFGKKERHICEFNCTFFKDTAAEAVLSRFHPRSNQYACFRTVPND